MAGAGIQYRPIDTSEAGLQRTLAFMRMVFPHAAHYSVPFLDWLYRRNPDGRAFGLEGFEGERMVAHLAGVPRQTVLKGAARPVVLLVNGATHPAYRGQGLYLRLVEKTCQHLADSGAHALIGVANQNTIRAYESKLGIHNVAGLQARIGLGDFTRIDWPRAEANADLSRVWGEESLAWRLANPSNPLAIASRGDGLVVRGATQYAAIDVHAPLPAILAAGAGAPGAGVVRRHRPLQLSLGLEPHGSARHGLSWPIPDRFKPSPLRLIYRHLHDAGDRLDPEGVLFSFLDFDAY